MRFPSMLVSLMLGVNAIVLGVINTNAQAADSRNPKAELRRVESCREQRLKAEADGTAKSRTKFGSSYITDAAIKEIVLGFPNLETLSAACHAHVGDQGAAQIGKLRKLKTLYVKGDVSDLGLKSIGQLRELQSLKISSEAITDRGLNAIASLNKLRTLQLRRTKVTEAGIRNLQKQIPDCKITCYPTPTAKKSSTK